MNSCLQVLSNLAEDLRWCVYQVLEEREGLEHPDGHEFEVTVPHGIEKVEANPVDVNHSDKRMPKSPGS